MRRVAARHWPVVVVLAVAAIERWWVARRVAVAVFQDSLVYLDLAFGSDGVPFHPARPSGYPLALRVLSWVLGEDAKWMTYAQHVSGLAVGVLVYVVVTRLTARRWLATLATALVAFDGYAISLERTVLAEPPFAFAAITGVALVLLGRDPFVVAVGGIAVAAAALLRNAGIFLAPVWLLYVVAVGRRRYPVWLPVSGLLFPLLLYMGLHAADGRGFSTNETDGWFLYGRIMATADCRGAPIPEATRPLCQAPGEGRMDPTNAVWNSQSPARKLFSGGVGPPPGEDYIQGMDRHSNSLLRRWALAVIARHPATYARLVAGDTYELFRPGGRGAGPEVVLHGDVVIARHYHALRPLLGLFLLAGAATSVAGAVRGRVRDRLAHWPEIVGLTGFALALVVGPTATTDLNVRFLVPAVPIITVLGVVTLHDVWASRAVRGETAATE